MAIDSTHAEHDKWAEDWKLIKTLQDGQRALRQEGETYVPKLSGQTPKEYASYIKRGSLFNATSKTFNGMVGAIIRKEATIKVPKVINVDDLTPSGQSIHEVIRVAAEEIMNYGFFGILVDIPGEVLAGTPPYMAIYDASDILNWYTQKVGKEDKLMMVTLLEKDVVQDPADPFTFKDEYIIRCCFIDMATGQYKQQLYSKVDRRGSKEIWEKIGDEIIPTKQGKSLTEIPFTFMSANGCYPVPSKPPLLDLANLNIKHWQLSTDYYHGLHYCAIPTPWAAGFDTGGALYIGAQKAWISNDPNAKCGFLEFTGQGIAAIEKALDKIEKLMAVAGARLLEEQKAGVEAADAIRRRSSGDDATLSSIVETIEQGIKKTLDIMSNWAGSGETSEVTMSREFTTTRLSAQEITALLGAVQAGKMSLDTFLYNLQTGDLLPPDRTVKEEKDLIEAEKPTETNEQEVLFGGGKQGVGGPGGKSGLKVV